MRSAFPHGCLACDCEVKHIADECYKYNSSWQEALFGPLCASFRLLPRRAGGLWNWLWGLWNRLAPGFLKVSAEHAWCHGGWRFTST